MKFRCIEFAGIGFLLSCVACASEGTDSSPVPMWTMSDSSPMQTPDMALPSIELPECVDARFSDQLPGEMYGQTDDADDSHGPAPCLADGTSGSNDYSVLFVSPTAGIYRFSTVGSSFDTVLHARSPQCDGQVLACNDDAVDTASAIELSLAAGESVILVVDGFNRDVGSVTLRVEGKETQCDNGADDDNDGLKDCDDADCFLSCEDPDAWPRDWIAFEEAVLEETNRARAVSRSCDMDQFEPAPPLEMDIYLTYAARLHARDMGLNDYFEHTSLDGRSATDRMRQAGFMGASPTGENIAAGQSTPAEVVESWINSPGHCRNIMDPDYTVLGVGYSVAETGRFDTYWVQNFGGSH
ncbi:MAG: CAP domain-containing protein [Myxococcota bacterium]|nr:CAP domain-containing protein [Myxococcota bacterium]